MRVYSGVIVSFSSFFHFGAKRLMTRSGNGREVPTCWVYE
jgi:hypothetical protein